MLFHRSTWSPTTYCYLEDLYVDRDVRRHGTGRALIKAVYEEADKRGATRTYWATKEDNRQARRLYDRVATLSPFVQMHCRLAQPRCRSDEHELSKSRDGFSRIAIASHSLIVVAIRSAASWNEHFCGSI